MSAPASVISCQIQICIQLWPEKPSSLLLSFGMGTVSYLFFQYTKSTWTLPLDARISTNTVSTITILSPYQPQGPPSQQNLIKFLIAEASYLIEQMAIVGRQNSSQKKAAKQRVNVKRAGPAGEAVTSCESDISVAWFNICYDYVCASA